MSGNNKKKKEDHHQIADFSESSINHTIQGFQDQLLLHHHPKMQHQNSTDAYFGVGGGGGGGSGGVGRSSLMFPSEVVSSPILPWTLPPPPPPPPLHHHHNVDHPFFLPPPPPTPSSSTYGGFFNRRPGGGVGVGGGGGLQFGYDHHHQGPSSSADHPHHHLRLISDSIGQVVQSSSAPFGLQAELQKMTAQEIMDAKALAASKSHSEAERRRRERINNHLAKLRSLLPNTTKTDKASLLAEVIQHVKELKRQTSLIAESSTVPTEMDELTVDNASSDEDGKLLIKASLCCEDRSDLLPDLIKTLKALRLRTLKAEITTLAGRVKNVLFITTEDDDDDTDTDNNVGTVAAADQQQQQQQQHYSIISSIQEALKAVMEKASGDDQSASGSVKRQRTNINIYP